MDSLSLFLDKLREVLTRKIDIKNPSKFRLFLVGIILAFVVLIFFLNTADFSKVTKQQFSLQNNLPPQPPPSLTEMPPPPPPPELLDLGAVQGR